MAGFRGHRLPGKHQYVRRTTRRTNPGCISWMAGFFGSRGVGGATVDEITPMRDADGAWRVAGYYPTDRGTLELGG